MAPHGQIFVIRKTGEDGSCFPLLSRTCRIGKGYICDIRVQRDRVLEEQCLIEVGTDSQARIKNFTEECYTLVGGVQLSTEWVKLKHKDAIFIGGRSFRWEYIKGSKFYSDSPLHNQQSTEPNASTKCTKDKPITITQESWAPEKKVASLKDGGFDLISFDSPQNVVSNLKKQNHKSLRKSGIFVGSMAEEKKIVTTSKKNISIVPEVIEVQVSTSTLDSSSLTDNGENSTNQTEAMPSVTNVPQKAKKVVSDKESEESVEASINRNIGSKVMQFSTNELESDSIVEAKSRKRISLRRKSNLFEVNQQIEDSTVNSIENSTPECDELKTPFAKNSDVSVHNANDSMLGADTPKTMRNTPHTAKASKKLLSFCNSACGTPSVTPEASEFSAMSSSTGKSSARMKKSSRVKKKWDKSICSVKNMASENPEKGIEIIVIPPTPDGNLECPKKEKTCISSSKQNILFSTLKKSAVKGDCPKRIGSKSKREVTESVNESLEDNGSFMEINSSKKISSRKNMSNLIHETFRNKSPAVRITNEMNSLDENIGEVSDVNGGQWTITDEGMSRRGSLRSRKSLNSSNVNEQSSIFQRTAAGCQSDVTNTPVPSDEEYASWFSQRNSLASTVGSKSSTPVLKRIDTHGSGTPNNIDEIRKVMQTPLIINVRDTPNANSQCKLGGIANGSEEKKFSPHIRRSNRKSIRSIGTPCFAASIYNLMKSRSTVNSNIFPVVDKEENSNAPEEEENNMSSTQEMNLDNADFLSDITNISCTGDGETDSLMQTSSLLLDESDMLNMQRNEAEESVMKSSWTSTPAVGNSTRKKRVNFGKSVCSGDLGKQAPHTPAETKVFHSVDIATPDSSSGMTLSLIGEPGDVKESIKKKSKETPSSRRSFQMSTLDVSCTSGASALESSYNSALDNTVTLVNTPSLFDQDRSDISTRSLRSCKSVLSYKSNITPIAKKQSVNMTLVKSGKKAHGERQELDDQSIVCESMVNDKASCSSNLVNESLSVVNGGHWTITNEGISRRGSLRSRKSLNSSNVNEQSSIFQRTAAGCPSDVTNTPVPSDEEYASWFSQRNSLASTVGSKSPTPVLKRNDTHGSGTPNNIDEIRKVMQTPLIINVRDTPNANSQCKLGGIANGSEEKKFSPHIRKSNRKSIRSIGTPCFAASIYNQMKSRSTVNSNIFPVVDKEENSNAPEEEENNMSSTQEMNLDNADFLSDITNISCTGDGETDSLMQPSSLLLDESDMLNMQGNEAEESVMKSSWTSTPAVGNSTRKKQVNFGTSVCSGDLGKQAPHTPAEAKVFNSVDIATPDSSSDLKLSLIGEPDVKESTKKNGKKTSNRRHSLNSCTSNVSIEKSHTVDSHEFSSAFDKTYNQEDNSNVSEKNLSLEGKRSLRSCKSISDDTAMTQSISKNFEININGSSTPDQTYQSPNISVCSTPMESNSESNYLDEEGEKKDILKEKTKRKSSGRKSSVNNTKDCITCPSTPDYSESVLSVLATPAVHILHEENSTERVFKELQSPSVRISSPVSPSREMSTVSSKEMFTPASNTSRRSKRNSYHNMSYGSKKGDNMTLRENTSFLESSEGFSSTAEDEVEMDSDRFGVENEHHNESRERITRSRKNSMNASFKITPEMRKSSASPLTPDHLSNMRDMLATQAETSGKRKSISRESSMHDSIKVTPQIRKITRRSGSNSPATPDYSDSMRDMLATPALHILQPVEEHLTERVDEDAPSLRNDFPSSATCDASHLSDQEMITPASKSSRKSSKGGRRSSVHVSDESTKVEVEGDTTYICEGTSVLSSSGEITSVAEVEETSVDSQEETMEIVNPNDSGKRKSLRRKSSMTGSFKITPLVKKCLRESITNPSTPDYSESISNLLATPSIHILECDEDSSTERVDEELQQASSLRSVSPNSGYLESPVIVKKIFTPTTHTSGRSKRSNRNSLANVSSGSNNGETMNSRENISIMGLPEKFSSTEEEEDVDSGRLNGVEGTLDKSGKRKSIGRKSSVNSSFKITPHIRKITRKSISSPFTPDYSDCMRDMLATPAGHMLQPVEKHLTERVDEDSPSLRNDFPSSATCDASCLSDKEMITPASKSSRKSSKGGRRSSVHVSDESTKAEVEGDTTYICEGTSVLSSSGEITSMAEVEETSVDSQEETMEMVNPNDSGKRKSLSRKSSLTSSFQITPLIKKVLRKSAGNPSTPDYSASISNLLATPSVHILECNEESSTESVDEELQEASSLMILSPNSGSLESPVSVKKIFTPATHTSLRSKRSNRNSLANVSNGSINGETMNSRENISIIGSPEKFSSTVEEEDVDSGRLNGVEGTLDKSGKRKSRGRKSSVNASFKITPNIRKITRKSGSKSPSTPDYSDCMRDILATPAGHILQPVEKHWTERVDEDSPSLRNDFPSSATCDASRLSDKEMITPPSKSSRKSSKGGRKSSVHVSDESTKAEVEGDTTYICEGTSVLSSSGEITSVAEVEETSVDSQEETMEMVNPNDSGKRKSLRRKSSMTGSFKITPLVKKCLRKSITNPSTPDYSESISNLIATPSVHILECDEESSTERVDEELQQASSLRSVSPNSGYLEFPVSVKKIFSPATLTSGRSKRSNRNSLANVSSGSINGETMNSRENISIIGSPEKFSSTVEQEDVGSGRLNGLEGTLDKSGKRKSRGRKSSVNASFKITPHVRKITRKNISSPFTPDYSDCMRDMLVTPAGHILQPVEKHLTERVDEDSPSMRNDFPSSATCDASCLSDKEMITPASKSSRKSSKGGRRSSVHVSDESTKAEVEGDTTYICEGTSVLSSSEEITSMAEVEETSVDSQEETMEMVNPNDSGKRKSLSRKSSLTSSFKITPLIKKVLRKSAGNPSTPDYSASISNLLATPSVHILECNEESSTESVDEELQEASSLMIVSPNSGSLESPVSVKKIFTPTTHTSGRSKRSNRNSLANVSNGSIKDETMNSRENISIIGSPEKFSSTVEEEDVDSGRLNGVEGTHDESGKMKSRGRKSLVNASLKITPHIRNVTRKCVSSPSTPDYSDCMRDMLVTPSDNARFNEDKLFSENKSKDLLLLIQRCDKLLPEKCVVPSLVDEHTDSFMSDKSGKSPGQMGSAQKLVDCPNECNTSSDVTSTRGNASFINTSVVFTSEVEEESDVHGDGLNVYGTSENKKSKGRTSAVFQESINCVKDLLAQRSPISRYSDFQGIKSLFNNETPHSSYLDVSGLKEIFDSHANSPVDVIACSKSKNSVVYAENVFDESSLPNSNPQENILTSLAMPVVLVSKLSPEHLASYIESESNPLPNKSRHSRRCTKLSNASSQRVTRRTKEAESHYVNSVQPELNISPVGKENKSEKGLKSNREGNKSVVAVKHLLVNAELNSLPVATTASVILKSNLRNITGQRRLKKNVQFDGLLEEVKEQRLEHNEDGILPTKRRSSRKSTSTNTTYAIFSNQKLPSKAAKNPEIGQDEDGGENDVVSTRRGHLRKRVITRPDDAIAIGENSNEDTDLEPEKPVTARKKQEKCTDTITEPEKPAANKKASATKRKGKNSEDAVLEPEKSVAPRKKEESCTENIIEPKKPEAKKEAAATRRKGRSNEDTVLEPEKSVAKKEAAATRRKGRSNEDTVLELEKPVTGRKKPESFTETTIELEKPVAKKEAAATRRKRSNEDVVLEPEKPMATRKKQQSCTENIIEPEKPVGKKEASATRRKRSNEDVVFEPEKPMATRKKQQSCTENIIEPEKSVAKKEASATRRKRSNEDVVFEPEKPMATRKKQQSCTENIIEPEKPVGKKEASATRRKRSNEDAVLEPEKPMATRKKPESCTENIIEPEKSVGKKEASATRRKRSNEDAVLEPEKPMATRKKPESCTENIIEPEKSVGKKEASATRRKRSNEDAVLEPEKPMATRKKPESCTENIIEPKKLVAKKEAAATRRKGKSNEDAVLEPEKPVRGRKKPESFTETTTEPKKPVAKKEAAATRRKGRSNEDTVLEPEKPMATRKKDESCTEKIIEPEKSVAKKKAPPTRRKGRSNEDTALEPEKPLVKRKKQESCTETIIAPDKQVKKEEAVEQENEREKHGDAAATTSGRFTRRGKVVVDNNDARENAMGRNSEGKKSKRNKRSIEQDEESEDSTVVKQARKTKSRNDGSKDSVPELAEPSTKVGKNVRKPIKATDVEKWQVEEEKSRGKQLRNQKVKANDVPKVDEANRSSRRPTVTSSSKDKTPSVTEEKLKVSRKRKESVSSLSEKTIKRSKSSTSDKGNMQENKKAPGRVLRKR